MIYREDSPHPALRPFVRCFWRLGGRLPMSSTERVVPDGCAEIVINRADRFRRFDEEGASRIQAEVLLVGQISRSIRIAPEGEVDLLGIRFEPAGLHALLGVPMHELTDRDVELGEASRRLHDRLAGASRVSGVPERIAAVEAVLWQHLCARCSPGEAELALSTAAVRRIATEPLATTEAVAAALRVSRRTLERAFRREVGVSPKLYLRIRRLAGVVWRLETAWPLPGWAALAVEHGYADQSHLIRDFRLLVGTTPERYRREQTTLTDLFTGLGAPRGESRSSNT